MYLQDSVEQQERILDAMTSEQNKFNELAQEVSELIKSKYGKPEVPVVKAVEPTLKQVTYVAMRANAVDAHGDFTSAEEVRKAKESFNKALMKKQTMSNLFHMYETNSYDVIESYLAPTDMVLNGHSVQKSDWLMTLQINDDNLWDMVLKGEVVGLSIGAVARVEKLE